MKSLALGVTLVLSVLVASSAAAAADLAVVSFSPPGGSMSAPVDGPIRVSFDRPVAESTVTCDEAFWAFGRWSGKVEGRYVFSEGGRTVTLVPERPLASGEHVLVILANRIEGVDGARLRSAGFSFGFWTRSGAGNWSFAEAQTVSTNIESESSRPYGGSASDFDGDGFPDLALTNEDTDDVRVLLNLGDCAANLSPVHAPTTPTGRAPSPNESADFDKDGNVDLCVANVGGGSVSILIGNGDGTFDPATEIPSGINPHGIATLDADGDGDLDVAVSNQGSGNVAVLLNDGSGAFGSPTFFDSGLEAEWTLASADMDLDGVFDLVVASREEERVVVMLGNGDGTFSPGTPAETGGETWMIVIGDVDLDGFPDVTAANAFTNTGSIIRNEGGVLQPPVSYPVGDFAVATDLGDLDGDGDLDWVTSSFFGDYFVFENLGDGTFAQRRTIQPTSNGSCALLVDFDLDTDLEIALIDEIADVVTIYRNGDRGADCDANGVPDACDIAYGAGSDCNGNGVLDTCDIWIGVSSDADANGVPDDCESALSHCARGAVDRGCGPRASVLFVNAEAGDLPRTVTLGVDDPLSMAVAESPARRCDGETTRCCVYGWVGAPQASDVIVLPRGLGRMCFGPLMIATTPPVVIWNSIGVYGRLGHHSAPGDPPIIPDGGTFELVALPMGVGASTVATFQGLIEDPCTQGKLPVSVTNGVTLIVR